MENFFYRQLERCKITALRQHKDDYKKVILTTGALADVHWWASNLHSASKFHSPAVIERKSPANILRFFNIFSL